jgi:hypothetical protein
MLRLALIVSLFASSAAFATGERISITGAATPLAETLCFSMECVQRGAKDFTVSGRSVKGGVEFTVTSTSGQVRLTYVAALNEFGQVSSTDLVHATSLVVRSIEKGPIPAPAAPAPVAKKAVKLPKSAVAKR